MPSLLSRREEVRVLRLARSQPESAGEFQELVDEIAERATAVALDDPGMRSRLEGVRHAVLGADYREDKPDPGEAPVRLAEIGVYDYDADVLVVAVVDLREGTVIQVLERRGVHPPVVAAELAAARDLVAGDDNLAPRIRHARGHVVAFPTPSFLEGHARRGHRCVTLHWTDSDGAGQATVDLSASQVVPNEELLSGSPRARLGRRTKGER